MKKNKEYYLSLEYGIATRALSEEEGAGILAYYTDMPFIAGDGEDIAEAIKDVKSAFASYLDVSLEKGDIIKEPSHLAKTKRINITVPLYALERIDKYAKSHNMNRSTFLVESALKHVGT
ncbi:MAG: type II toxin-antitoxin system HicB family antitoxin [Campylobacterota bacterium]|nr:type II toxin-antitoxin system HicB family antitoxin [Campylobacterota bacterium]